MKKILVLFALAFTLFSCSKDTREEESGIIRNFTGLDGCGMVIVLDNGKVLEPVSLPSNITLVADQRVAVEFRVVYRASNCMAGQTAEIISLRYL